MKYCYVLFLYTFTCYGSWAEQKIKELSLREKIGQLCVVSAASDFTDDNKALAHKFGLTLDELRPEVVRELITNYAVGGIIFLLRSTPTKQVALTNEYQHLSKLPLLICLDAEWGLSMRLDDTVRFPRNMTLGALNGELLVEELGKEIGRQCKLLGVHMNFAPVIDINTNPANPVINDRSFGEEKERVARLGSLYARGLQASGVLSCAKHYPGHGDAAVDSHTEPPLIKHPKSRMKEVELYPFKSLIVQGVPAIMTAHLSVPAMDPSNLSSLSSIIINSVLKNDLGFKGLVVSDGLNMGALTKHDDAANIALKAFLAGTDILLCIQDVPHAIDKIEQAVRGSKMLAEELDARVLKLLKVKELMELHKVKTVLESEIPGLTSQHALALKRELYRQAITVVQDRGALPASPDVFMTLIGGGEQEPFARAFTHKYFLPVQATQGEGDEILAALSGAQKIVIGVLGMNKFMTQNFGLSESTLSFIKKLNDEKKQVILTLFGNPYSLKNFGEEAAIIVAYEDDQDAQEAAADVVLGRLVARGRLPVTASPQFPVGTRVWY